MGGRAAAKLASEQSLDRVQVRAVHGTFGFVKLCQICAFKCANNSQEGKKSRQSEDTGLRCFLKEAVAHLFCNYFTIKWIGRYTASAGIHSKTNYESEFGVFQTSCKNLLTFFLHGPVGHKYCSFNTEAADAAAEAAGVHAMRAALDANLTLEQVADEAWNREFLVRCEGLLRCLIMQDGTKYET